MEKLTFTLPKFFRQAWVSDQAKSVWRPRIVGIKQMWHILELASVGEGLRDCALVVTPVRELKRQHKRAERYGLLPVELSSPAFLFPGKTISDDDKFIVMGSAASTAQFRAAWQSNDHLEMGRLLGYPTCCCQFYQRHFVELEFCDLTWHVAQNTNNDSIRVIDDRCYEFEREARTNIMLYRVGIKPTFHIPCSFDCQRSIELADSLAQLGRDIRHESDVAHLNAALSWPMQWTALHGIAEIKTPILKAVMDTDVTGQKYTVRLHSGQFPKEGGRGLRFPYLQLKRREKT